MGMSKHLKPCAENVALALGRTAQGLACDRLHRRQSVFDAVLKFLEQKLLAARFLLRSLVEARVLDCDRGVGSDPHRDVRGILREHAARVMAEKQSAYDLA